MFKKVLAIILLCGFQNIVSVAMEQIPTQSNNLPTTFITNHPTLVRSNTENCPLLKNNDLKTAIDNVCALSIITIVLTGWIIAREEYVEYCGYIKNRDEIVVMRLFDFLYNTQPCNIDTYKKACIILQDFIKIISYEIAKCTEKNTLDKFNVAAINLDNPDWKTIEQFKEVSIRQELINILGTETLGEFTEEKKLLSVNDVLAILLKISAYITNIEK